MFPIMTLHTKDGSNSIDRNEFCQGDLDLDGGREKTGGTTIPKFSEMPEELENMMQFL